MGTRRWLVPTLPFVLVAAKCDDVHIACPETVDVGEEATLTVDVSDISQGDDLTCEFEVRSGTSGGEIAQTEPFEATFTGTAEGTVTVDVECRTDRVLGDACDILVVDGGGSSPVGR